MDIKTDPALLLSACAQEPITRLDRIQSFGLLLGLSSDWHVVRASDNLEAMLGIPVAEALGQRLDDLLDRSTLHDIRNRMLALYLTKTSERLFGVNLVAGRGLFDVSVHQSDETFILEAEPSQETTATDASLVVRRAMARLAMRATLEAFHNDAARQIRSMTGFDRVMVYRFDESGDGEVIAEALSADMESYLGLHYPASDIPSQARALYLNNPFRIIPDISTPTIEIKCGHSGASPLDLTLSVTRAVSPVHIEYLYNMGVAASMSISIIVERKLWGLIACHHRSPRLPSFVVRTSAELFGQMYSMSLQNRLREASQRQEDQLTEATRQILTAVVGDDALLNRAEWLQDILRDVIGGRGTAIAFRGDISVAGDTPSLAVIAQIIRLLNAQPPKTIFATDHLTRLVPAAADYVDRAAGLLAIPLSSTARDYLLLFRGEVLRSIRWAGNPAKPVHSDPAARISPRKSFAVFEDRVAGRSTPFSARDRRAAEVIRSALMEVVLKVSESADDARQRASERQEILIAELNHRVRNILTLMRGLIGQSRADANSVEEYAAAIRGRIAALARAHDRVTRANWSPALFSSLLDDEIAAYAPTDKDRISIVGAPVYLTPKAFSTMALVIHELVTNSCKYGALSAAGRVEIDMNRVPDRGLHFKWRERGGPQVCAPTRRGFGSVIIERTVPFDLQGTAVVEYALAGFEASFFIPDAHIGAPPEKWHVPDVGNGTEAAAKAGIPERPLEGLLVLLLEDNFIVALEAEELLLGLGAATVVVASSVAGALQAIARKCPQFAMLDINLGFETSYAVAKRLTELKVPYIVASGYGDDLQRTADPNVATVTKPFDRDSIRLAISQSLKGQP